MRIVCSSAGKCTLAEKYELEKGSHQVTEASLKTSDQIIASGEQKNESGDGDTEVC
jgi:hypothetical protein